MKHKVKIRIEIDYGFTTPEIIIRTDQQTDLVNRIVSAIGQCAENDINRIRVYDGNAALLLDQEEILRVYTELRKLVVCSSRGTFEARGTLQNMEKLLDAERSSCGEIVQQLIIGLNGKMTKSEATLLYIALTTDTGAFQYANVNEGTYRSAAELLRAGADHSSVMVHFFRKVSLARLRLEGLIYSGLHIHRDGKLVVATVTQEMMEHAGATEDDCDDLAGLSGRAENALMNITIRELKDGSSKVSVRSAPGVSSNAVCSALGGGGHELAAGCTLQIPPDQAEKLLLEVIDAVCGDQL